MKKLLFIVLVLFFSSSYSQNTNFSVKLSYNLPYVADVKGSFYNPYSDVNNLLETHSSKLSGKLSGNIEFIINSRILIETGLQLNLLRYQQESKLTDLPSHIEYEGESVNWDELDGINLLDSIYWGAVIPITSFSTSGSKNISVLYTEIPIQIAYTFFKNKLKCNIGIITSFLTYSKIYTSRPSYNPRSNVVSNEDNSGDGFSNILLSSNVGIEYLIYENIGLNLNYSRSFNSIYDEYFSIGKPKYNIFSLGISYNFFK